MSFYRARELLEAHAVWGGVPRYWELAADLGSVREAVRELVLDPMGVLFEEPTRLLLDEMQEVVQASSVLSLIGAGCHRLSEIAGRLQKPATALSGPLRRLVGMGSFTYFLKASGSKLSLCSTKSRASAAVVCDGRGA